METIDEMKKKDTEKDLMARAASLVEEEQALANNEAFKAFMLQKKSLDDKISEFKNELKRAMVENGIKSITSPKGKDDWSITCSVAHKIDGDDSVDIDDVDVHYIEEKEMDMSNIIVKGGKVYQRVKNIVLVKNERALNMPLPTGFVDKEIPRISIKVGGKAI